MQDLIKKKLETAKTTQEYLEAYLWSFGIFESDAKAIVEYAKPSIEKAGRVAWDRPKEEYPTEMYAALLVVLKAKAIEWARNNKPQAFWIEALRN